MQILMNGIIQDLLLALVGLSLVYNGTGIFHIAQGCDLCWHPIYHHGLYFLRGQSQLTLANVSNCVRKNSQPRFLGGALSHKNLNLKAGTLFGTI